MHIEKILCAFAAVVVACVFMSGCFEAEDGSSVLGPQEVWAGELHGEAKGTEVCSVGTDAYYTETGKLMISMPKPGIAKAMNKNDATEASGVFSNDEAGTEATGEECTGEQSVLSGSVEEEPVRVRIVQRQIQVSSGSVLMPARFVYGKNSATALNAKNIYLNPSSISATRIMGTWVAIGETGSGIEASGYFVLDKK